MTMSRVAVIGAGSWGTAIAHLLGEKDLEVMLWAHEKTVAEAINAGHRNPNYLSDVVLSECVHATSSYEEACVGSDAIVIVTPSIFIRSTAEALKPYVAGDTPIIVLSKGIEADTGFTMVDVLEDVLGNPERLAALAGPNHAEEISKGLPAATVVASSDEHTARFFQDLFYSPYLRVYRSSDVIGVEICAAAKNIIAIANGMVDAMGLGDNAEAALMTRGLAEIARLVDALGGDSRTCMGLAGLGDLVVTCTSPHSRNRTLGEMLVAGQTLADFEAKTHMVAEGAVACRTVVDLAHKHGIEMPVAELVRQVLWENLPPREGVTLLLERPKRAEFDAEGW